MGPQESGWVVRQADDKTQVEAKQNALAMLRAQKVGGPHCWASKRFAIANSRLKQLQRLMHARKLQIHAYREIDATYVRVATPELTESPP